MTNITDLINRSVVRAPGVGSGRIYHGPIESSKTTTIYRRSTDILPAGSPMASLIQRSVQRSGSTSGITRTGVIPSSTFVPRGTVATESVFGGASGGMGPATTLPTTSAGPLTLSGIGSSFSKASVGVMNTLGTLIPLAIKVILAVIVIKIVLWLIKRRR